VVASVVWVVMPEIICRVRADEVTLVSIHPEEKDLIVGGICIIIPALYGYRSDKSVQETTTDAEIKRLYED